MSTPATDSPAAPQPRLAERLLAELTTAWQVQAEQFVLSVRAGLDRAAGGTAEDDPSVPALARTLVELEQRMAFIEARLNEESARGRTLDQLVWPRAFENGELARSRALIEQRLGDPASGALELFLAVGGLTVALRPPLDDLDEDTRLRRIAQVLGVLGERAYAHWKAIGADLNAAAPQWQEELNAFLKEQNLPLEITAALPGAVFDMDCMETSDYGLGNRLQVEEPFSWVVRWVTETDSRVLQHARVKAC